MNLTIKNIPERVYKTLKKEAARRRHSLNQEAILALSSTAAEVERRRQMHDSRDDLERFVARLPKMSCSVPMIRRERERH